MFSSEDDMTAYSDLHHMTGEVFFERVVHVYVFTGNKETKMLFLASKGEINGWQTERCISNFSYITGKRISYICSKGKFYTF